MRPYFASWEESTHHDVYCTECHLPPSIAGKVKGKFTAASMLVNYATGVYKKSKPWAEIEDKSCLKGGCHESRLLEGKVLFKEGIIFDHKPHLTQDRRGKNLRCTSCHSQIVQGSHMSVTEETCFLCHFKDQPDTSQMTNCNFCHHAPTVKDSANVIFDHTDILGTGADCRLCHGEMVTGDGDVPKERCSYCHAEVGKIEKYGETTEIHQIHISNHKVECNHCHNTIQHLSVARTGKIKPDCQACHLDRHQAQYSLFSGQGAVGVDPMPSSMFHAGLGCKACHVILPEDWETHPDLATTTAGKTSCMPCHNENYFELYNKAKPLINEKIKSSEARIASVKMQKLSAAEKQIVNECEENIQLLQLGKPIHNLGYSDRIIDALNRQIDSIEGKQTKPIVLPDSASYRCVKCHYGMAEASVQYGDKTFSHHLHVLGNETGCAYCHIDSEQNHGDLKNTDLCIDCHHSKAKVSCEPCHKSQRDLFKGEGAFEEYDPDVMSEAELTCRDCHEVNGTKVSRPGEGACEACHEPGYWEMYAEMRAEIEQQLDEIEAQLNRLPQTRKKSEKYKIIESIKLDGTLGAHNIIAVQDAIDMVLQYLKQDSVEINDATKN